jgi:hypothetical protein
MKIAIATALLVAGIAAARADEASDYLAAAGDEVKAYGQCTVDKAWPLIKSQLSEEEIAQRAIDGCSEKAGAVREALKGEPTNLSDEKAAEVEEDVTDNLRRNVITIVHKQRN